MNRVTRCDEDVVEALYNDLKSYGLKEVTISMILNILPQSVDELRTLLVFEEKVPDENILKEIVEKISQQCSKKQ